MKRPDLPIANRISHFGVHLIPLILIPLTLSCSQEPPLSSPEVSHSELAFGTVVVGQQSSQKITITNNGAGDLKGAVLLDSPHFSVQESDPTFSLGEGESSIFTIVFAPQLAGSHAAFMELGPDFDNSIPCEGEGIYVWTKVETGITEGIWSINGTNINDLYIGTTSGIYFYDGLQWSPTDQGDSIRFVRGIWPVWNSYYAITETGFIWIGRGTEWGLVGEMLRPDNEPYTFSGIWSDNHPDQFNEIGFYLSTLDGILVRFNSGGTTAEPDCITDYFQNDLWGVDGAIVAVGREESITWRGGGSCHTELPGFTWEHLNGVWGSSASDLWTVGNWGLILHYDGSEWQQVELPDGVETTTHFFAVWGRGSDDVFIVGSGGVILHFDGSELEVMDNAYGYGLSVVWGVGDYVFAGGGNGLLLKYGPD